MVSDQPAKLAGVNSLVSSSLTDTAKREQAVPVPIVAHGNKNRRTVYIQKEIQVNTCISFILTFFEIYGIIFIENGGMGMIYIGVFIAGAMCGALLMCLVAAAGHFEESYYNHHIMAE